MSRKAGCIASLFVLASSITDEPSSSRNVFLQQGRHRSQRWQSCGQYSVPLLSQPVGQDRPLHAANAKVKGPKERVVNCCSLLGRIQHQHWWLQGRAMLGQTHATTPGWGARAEPQQTERIQGKTPGFAHFGQVSLPSSPFPRMGQLFQHHPTTLHHTEPSQQGFMHVTTARTRGRRKRAARRSSTEPGLLAAAGYSRLRVVQTNPALRTLLQPYHTPANFGSNFPFSSDLNIFNRLLCLETKFAETTKTMATTRKTPTKHQHPNEAAPSSEAAQLCSRWKRSPGSPKNPPLSFKRHLKGNEHANPSTPQQDSKNNISSPQRCGQEYICSAGRLRQQRQKPFAGVNEVLLAAERMQQTSHFNWIW